MRSAAAALAFLPAAFSTGCRAEARQEPAPARTEPHRVEIVSDAYTIDDVFESMHGPGQLHDVALPDTEAGELVWLTAIENRAVDPATGSELSEEFLCHNNLLFAGGADQLRRDEGAFSATANLERRVVTLIQGRNRVRFPEGFGFPVTAGEPLAFFSMVINKNVRDLPFELQVRTTLEYLRDAELKAPPVPLFRRRLFTFVAALDGGDSGGQHGKHTSHKDEAGGRPGAVPPSAPVAREEGDVARGELASGIVGRDAAGNEYTFHWLVPPGRHVYRSPVTAQLRLPFGTTLHYAAAHLHPYGEAIEIRDLTSGDTLLRLRARQYDDRVGIAEMEEYASARGIPFRTDHDYEMVSTYDNPTGEPIDAMAIIYLYLADHAFARAPGQPAS